MERKTLEGDHSQRERERDRERERERWSENGLVICTASPLSKRKRDREIERELESRYT